MSGSIPIPFAVGSKAWLARIAQEPEWVDCPSCNGTMKHSVSLGCGETHVVWCGECGADRRFDYDHSYNSDSVPGKTRRYGIRAEVECVTLEGVEVRGEEVNYTSSARNGGRYIYRCEGLFATEAEARAHAEVVLIPKARQMEEERFVNNLRHGRGRSKAEDVARKATFWARQRAEAVETLARIDRRIERLKAERKAGA